MSKLNNSWGAFSKHFIRIVWDLCRLKSSPENLPYSIIVLLMALGANVGIALINLLRRPNTLQLLAQSCIALLVQMLVLALLLLGFKKLNRFIQMATALFSTGFIISLLHLTLVGLFIAMPFINMVFFGYATIILLVWSMLITAHILRCTLTVPFFVALLLSTGLVLLSNLILALMAGAP